jgi:hypothetical protein
MKLYIKKLFLLSFSMSLLTFFGTHTSFAQDTNRQTKSMTLEELYAIPNNQNAWLKTVSATHDTFFCNPGDLDNLSLSYFCHVLKRSNKNILQIKRNALTNIITVICIPKSLNEEQLHDIVGKIKKEIYTILQTEPNPYATMEEKSID